MARNLLRIKPPRSEMSVTIPERSVDLHGGAPDKQEIALLLIDVINDFDSPGANQLLKNFLKADTCRVSRIMFHRPARRDSRRR
jgi:hypothetical protein